MSSKRRLLFLMPSLRGGGAERTLINLLQKIDYKRYEIDLIVVSKHGPYLDQVPMQVNVIYFFNNTFLARILGYLHRTFNYKGFFQKKMQSLENEYDVGISFLDTNFTNLLFYNKKIDRKVAFIHSSYRTHENYERFYKYKRYKRKQKKRYNRLDAIYFVSEDSMEEFKEVFGEYDQMGVIYNMIDGETVRKKARLGPRVLPEGQFSFSAFGSLIPVKGFDRMIRAAALVRDRGYEFSLNIAGSGPEEAKLRRLIDELKLGDVVTLHEFLSNPYPLMKQSDVFVMSSKSEALPTVLCEAMTLGVPTLVTNCSGCRCLVDHGEYGLMAEQDDHDLADKMMRYMDEPELLKLYHEKSMERAKIFDDEKVLNKYYDIFDGNILEYS